MSVTDKELESYMHNRFRRSTAESYLFAIRQFLETNPNASKYSSEDIQRYLGSKNNVTDTYRSKLLSCLKAYFDCLIELDSRDKHPCQTLTIKVHRSRQIQLQNLFLPDELEELLERLNRYKMVDKRNKVLISFMIYQGLSSSELVNLKISDVNSEECYIYIKSKSSRINSRKLQLEAKQINWIKEYLSQRYKSLNQDKFEYFFISKLNTKLTVDGIHSIFDQFKTLYLPRKISPSTIRQSVISNWINHYGKSMDDTLELSGIKNLSTLVNYKDKLDSNSRNLLSKHHPLSKLKL